MNDVEALKIVSGSVTQLLSGFAVRSTEKLLVPNLSAFVEFLCKNFAVDRDFKWPGFRFITKQVPTYL